MDIEIQNGEEMYQYVNKNKYLVIYPNRNAVLFKSLRDIDRGSPGNWNWKLSISRIWGSELELGNLIVAVQ